MAAVKIIGAVYKIPLGNIIGDEGKAHFTVAYNIYNLLLTISTAGLPLAISKLTSEAHALGRENEKRKIFRTAIWLFFALGACFSLLMYFGAEQLAAFMVDDLAFWSIRALAPAVFCVCLLACMRGYTQGQGNMKPTAISQVLEALCKLGFGLSLAWYFLQLGYGVEISAAGAILGVTIGTIMSMLFLIFYLVTHREMCIRDRLSAVQGQLADVEPLSGDHQRPLGGGHDEARLVEPLHILHTAHCQTLPALQLQAVGPGLHGLIVHCDASPRLAIQIGRAHV